MGLKNKYENFFFYMKQSIIKEDHLKFLFNKYLLNICKFKSIVQIRKIYNFLYRYWLLKNILLNPVPLKFPNYIFDVRLYMDKIKFIKFILTARNRQEDIKKN